jgi:hypothetical protein
VRPFPAKHLETPIETHPLPHLLNLPLIRSKIAATNTLPTRHVHSVVSYKQPVALHKPSGAAAAKYGDAKLERQAVAVTTAETESTLCVGGTALINSHAVRD